MEWKKFAFNEQKFQELILHIQNVKHISPFSNNGYSKLEKIANKATSRMLKKEEI